MSRFPLTSTSRALYRVFVAPNLAPSHPVLHRAPPHLTRLPPVFPQIHKRAISYKKKAPTRNYDAKEFYTLDNDIEGSDVNLVDADGVFHPNVTLADALRKYNRVTHHLLLVSPGTVDEFGISDPNDLPTCKVVTKINLRDNFQKKVELKRREEAAALGVTVDAKKLELNWAIAGGDLAHRLARLREFLMEGKKVEVTFSAKGKRRGKQAAPEEAEAVLEAVKEAVAECPGAKEFQAADGNVGGLMTLFFEGKDLSEKPEKAEAAVVQENLNAPVVKSKFKEKLERKQKEEEENKRKQMEQRIADQMKPRQEQRDRPRRPFGSSPFGGSRPARGPPRMF
jgi:translation initiation factor IF-3